MRVTNVPACCTAALLAGLVLSVGLNAQTPNSPVDTPSGEGLAESERVAAGETREPGVLGTVVVTATSLETENFYVPYVADTLSGDTVNVRKASRTLPEAFRETPGVHVQKTGHGQGSPFIRGFTGFRTLLLIDGVRLNNAVMRDGPNQYWTTIDPLTVSGLELVKGPSSVLHGSDAIGGTVRVMTRGREPLEASDEPDVHFGSGAHYRFAGAEDSHAARGELSMASGPEAGRLGVLGGVSYRNFGDLSGGRHTGELSNTAYDELDGDAKAIWKPEDELELVLAFQRVTQDDVPRTHSTVFSESSDVDRDRAEDQSRSSCVGNFPKKPSNAYAVHRLA